MPKTATVTAIRTKSNGSAPAAPESSTDNPVKDLLDRYGFEYSLVQLNIADIDRKTSERNQARIAKPIDEDTVILYAEAMSRGDKFPPIVVYKSGDKYIVMDGNHRTAGADMADITSLDAYVIKNPSPAQVETFTYEANTRHGLPTSLKDRLLQAILLVERGASIPTAAEQLSIPENQLRNAWDLHEAEKRFSGLGIKKFDRLSATSRRRLDQIPNDVVLKAAAELTLESAMGGEELTKLVKEVNSVKTSEADQLAVVARWRKSRSSVIKATAGGRVKVAQPLTTFQRITSTLNRTNVDTLVKHFEELSPEVRSEYVKAAAGSIQQLMDVVAGIRKLDASA